MNKSLRTLFEAYLNGKSSQAECLTLLTYFKIPGEEALLKNCILQELQKEVLAEADSSDLDSRLDATHDHLKNYIRSTHKAKYKKQIRLNWGYAAAIAASITILIGIVLFHQINSGAPDALTKKTSLQPILPGSNKAVLTLASGKKVNLSALANRTLSEENGIEITKTNDGQLIYQVKAQSSNQANQLYNTIETPKGGQYQIHLPDGTKVWLNAGSTLKYPLSFAGLKTRSVTLQGEAYFEVAKNKLQPFRVTSANQVIQVLGTHFNVSAYPEDHFTKTTLLEGRVSVGRIDASQSQAIEKVLQPGEQSLITRNSFELRTPIDAEAEIAWKNGRFVFVDEPIEEIMKKIARWYDIDIVYQGELKNKAFAGSVSRFDDLSKLLGMIEATNTVHFKIKGRSVIVMD